MKEWNIVNCLGFKNEVEIVDNPLNLNIEEFLETALRNNNKRRFLFVSKTLGKHLPVHPERVDALGELLSKAYKMKYDNYLNENALVIGFAETATCLAHSFFNYLESADFFIHTTREEVKDYRKLEFLEEHSHATEQNLYIDNLDTVNNLDSIILVDDEITTAKTCVNMIKQMQNVYNAKKYVIASILNWIDEDRRHEIESEAEKLNCKIEFIYLFNGKFKFNLEDNADLSDCIEEVKENNNEIEINNINLDFKKYIGNKKYLMHSGRFGITRKDQNELLEIIKNESKKLKPKYDNHEVLALGIEEFMYIPMMLSKEINGEVYYHSLTRSPILPRKLKDYPIKDKYKFESFYNENINYVYNLKEHNYKECFLFMEIEKDKKCIDEFIKILKHVGIKKINIVRC